MKALLVLLFPVVAAILLVFILATREFLPSTSLHCRHLVDYADALIWCWGSGRRLEHDSLTEADVAGEVHSWMRCDKE